MDDTTMPPHLVRLAGRPVWRFADGRVLPLLAGGSPEGEGEGEGEGAQGQGEGEGAGEGQGQGNQDDARTLAARARREAAELRKRLKQAEEERDQLKAATQTDAERLAARAEAAEGTATKATERVRTLALRLAVLEVAPTLGVVDPRLAAKLVDTSGVEYDDDGEPDRDQVKAQLEKMVQEHPHLIRAGDVDPGQRDAPAEGSGVDAMNDWLRGKARSAT